MTTTYTQERNPWQPDGALRHKFDAEARTRQVAANAIDMLGVVAVHAGRNWDARGTAGGQPRGLFPGRALVTRASDPVSRLRHRRVQLNRMEHQQQYSDPYDAGGGGDYYPPPQHPAALALSAMQQQRSGGAGAVPQSAAAAFEYENMAELEGLGAETLPLGYPSLQQRELQQQHNHRQQQQDIHQSNNESDAAAPAAATSAAQHEQLHARAVHLFDREAQQLHSHLSASSAARDAERARARQLEGALARDHGLRLTRSAVDMRHARECKYGISTRKRGSFAAPPLDPRDYPAVPVRVATVRDRPLVHTGARGDFIRAGEASGSFAHTRRSEIDARLEERKQTRSAALQAALEEIRFHDRALLVQVPWRLSNHKNSQVAFMGGGKCEIAEPSFLVDNVIE